MKPASKNLKLSNSLALQSDIKKSFASPFRNEGNSLAKGIERAVIEINKLKPEQGKGGAFLGINSALTIDFKKVKNISLAQKSISFDEIIKQVIQTFEGLPNWGHPLNMSNVCPQENIAAIVASMLTQVFSPNILEGEYAWNTARAELESVAILANLAGWNAQKAGGIYTYGGSGCWTYHLKYALSRVLPGSREKGIRTDAKVICSQQAHYTMLNSTDWSGLGMENIIKVKTVTGSNEMDMEHLEEVLKECYAKKMPVASVVCTMGTTDANAFDPVKKVRRLLRKYPNDRKYGKAFLYCDAVIGWSWMTFKDYNFKENVLSFSAPALKAIDKNYKAVKDIFYADAFGVDFHKCFSPLASSIFVYKNAKEFEQLLSRKEAGYLQKRSPYNPHNYSLEVSRSAGGSMSGWATLKFLGAEGFQTMLGNILENKIYLVHQLQKHKDIVCVNSEDTGWVTLLRIYARGVNAAGQYENELKNPTYKAVLKRNNKTIDAIGELLWKWFREGKKINGRPTAYLSTTTGFRPATYNVDLKDKKAVIYAIKIYPVNVFITRESMDHAVDCIVAARDEIVAD
ncbi:MAG TPA: pyridoxal-dependent decarboxylase [Chitinophagaceae bacterium]|nr:pyridoxal-dependent decarboxylase [Chitinophagaceae bacterium]